LLGRKNSSERKRKSEVLIELLPVRRDKIETPVEKRKRGEG
jgi:hypothetical protein